MGLDLKKYSDAELQEMQEVVRRWADRRAASSDVQDIDLAKECGEFIIEIDGELNRRGIKEKRKKPRAALNGGASKGR